LNQSTTYFFTHDQYVGDKLDYVVHIPKLIEVKRFNEFYQKNPKSTVQMQNGQTIHFYPTNKVKDSCRQEYNHKSNKVVAAKYYDSIVPYRYRYQRKALYKNRLMMLDIVANNNGKTYLL
jgi:hypothetical protein